MYIVHTMLSYAISMETSVYTDLVSEKAQDSEKITHHELKLKISFPIYVIVPQFSALKVVWEFLRDL